MSTEMKKAKEIIDGLIRHQQNSTDKLQNIEKQLSDLKTAQRLIEESQQAPAVVDYAPESELKSFVKEDGSKNKHVESSSGRRVTVEEAGLLDTEANCTDWHKELKEIARDRHLARLIMPDPYTPKLDARLYRHLNKAPRAILPAIQKAFNDQAGTGAEFIPDQFISDLYQEFQVPKRLRGLLNRVEAERNTLLIPRLNRGGRPYIKGEITVDSPLSQYTTSTASTGQKTINIKGLACSYVIDDAFAEDSAIAALPILSQQIVQDIEDAFEDCMINGDTAATHQDDIANWNIRSRWGNSGLGSASDHRKSFDGMRAAANDQGNLDVTGTASGVTAAEILGGLSSLGELGAGNIVMVCSPEFMLKHLMALTEVKTLDVFGPQASIVNGQIASVFGVPVVMSRFMSADLANTGLFTGAGSQTGYLLFNTSSWYLYERRGIVLEQQKDISAGAIRLVATYRAVMGSPDQAGIKNVYNGSDYNS
jgi:HK97 family phage major capsid protein